MSSENRLNYLNNVFNNIHQKLNNAFEEIHDGEFEQGQNTLNSIIYDVRELKKTMRP
jgi:predicted translin family RNA/ssDNA-binding protein